MSKVNLDAIKVDMLKKREKIERLEKRIKYLQEKVFILLNVRAAASIGTLFFYPLNMTEFIIGKQTIVIPIQL